MRTAENALLKGLDLEQNSIIPVKFELSKS